MLHVEVLFTPFSSSNDITFSGTCSLIGNVAGKGGAIYAAESKMKVNDDISLMIMSSTAHEIGGGAYLRRSVLTCHYCSVTAFLCNNGIKKGGGIHAINSLIKVLFDRSSHVKSAINFTENRSKMGGGVYLESSAELIVVKSDAIYNGTITTYNFHFVSNLATEHGGAVYVADERNFEACSG